MILVNDIRIRWIVASVLTVLTIGFSPGSQAAPSSTEALLDWSDWETYRGQIQHPSLGIKVADIKRARKNIKHHAWARTYAKQIVARVDPYIGQLTPEFLSRMVPATTPLSRLFTPCPACRDQGEPYRPHGAWNWRPEKSEELECSQCKTIYPNGKYPETIELRSTYDPSQVFTYYGGDTFQIFNWKHGRPSFSGNIRNQKTDFMVQLTRDFASAYTLTGKPEYADASRKILLRFAEVYPHYLVTCAYGEVADMAPREAALTLRKMPVPELTYPPNKPNHSLFVHFWTAGRASGSGIEGYQIRQWVETYDLTCEATTAEGKAVYSAMERKRIERDLLLESTILPIGDPATNNKSVANRSAVGMVGICLGLPQLTRYGLENFHAMVDDWFLPDGGTPESISYGFMGINGVRDLTLAFRNYTDPPGYRDPIGRRYDNYNVFQDSNYPRIWKAFVECLQPNLLYPPFADSRYRVTFPAIDAEILALEYPDEPRYEALLAALSSSDGTPADPAAAIYLRDPDFTTSGATQLTFPDHCLPDLRIGFMRSGEEGREGLLLMSASHWGVHRHKDSLNLYYWKNGHELLTDLGYLWDHADEDMTFRTFAHNLVIIDEEEQESRERGGEVEWFQTGKRVKAMRASSLAYPDGKMYRRTAALIDHGNGQSYAVDLFEVQGGDTRDYVYHGPIAATDTNGIALSEHKDPVYDLTQIRAGTTTESWTMEWRLAKNMLFRTWNVPDGEESVYVGSGWGQRDSTNQDRGTTIPYIIRRSEGNRPSQFVSVFEGNPPGKHFVQGVRRLPVDASSTTDSQPVVLEVRTRAGIDYIAWNITDSQTILSSGTPELPKGQFVVLSEQNGQTSWTELVPPPPY